MYKGTLLCKRLFKFSAEKYKWTNTTAQRQ